MEYITANGIRYECRSTATGIGTISFIMEGQEISNVEKSFRDVTELEVSGEEGKVYGTYKNISFVSAAVYEDGSICVVMHIPDAAELAIKELQQSQAEQDEVIAELIGGGM